MKKPKGPIRITKKKRPPPDDSREIGSQPRFVPVSPRERRDGWTPDKQVAFIDALAECACVTEACEHVGLSPSTAYRLRRRPDAYSFRAAWDAALDYGIRRLSDAAFSRALKGVTRPVFYQGEQVGERRYYDERLTMFMLRYRDPDRYGAWLDRREPRRRPDGQALSLGLWSANVADDAWETSLGAVIDREREDDGVQWLTDAEARMVEEALTRVRLPTSEATDARIRAAIAVLQWLEKIGITAEAIAKAEFDRLIAAEQARQAAAAAAAASADDAASASPPPAPPAPLPPPVDADAAKDANPDTGAEKDADESTEATKRNDEGEGEDGEREGESRNAGQDESGETPEKDALHGRTHDPVWPIHPDGGNPAAAPAAPHDPPDPSAPDPSDHGWPKAGRTARTAPSPAPSAPSAGDANIGGT